jgi:NitT/TauT family transport system substrate-binding protein
VARLSPSLARRNHDRTRALIATAAVATILAPLSACVSGTPQLTTSGGLDEVNVGVIAIVDVAPLYVGIQQGFFSRHGIKVNPQVAQGGATMVPDVVSGLSHFGFSDVTSLLVARSRNVPVKIIAAGNYSTGMAGSDFGAVVVPADSPIKGPRDLAGHTVAVNNLNNIGDTTVRASVHKAGGDATSVRFTEVDFPDAPAALKARQVDAAWVVEPFLSIARAQGNRVVAWNLVDTDPNLMVAAFFATNQLAARSPDLVARFRTAVNESLTYAQQNPQQARTALQAYTKIDPTLITELTLPRWSPDINRPAIERLANLAQSDGLVTTAPDLTALLP